MRSGLSRLLRLLPSKTFFVSPEWKVSCLRQESPFVSLFMLCTLKIWENRFVFLVEIKD